MHHGQLRPLIFLPTANAGQVVNVSLAILIGSFSLAMMAPELQGQHRTCGLTSPLNLLHSHLRRSRRGCKAVRHHRAHSRYRLFGSRRTQTGQGCRTDRTGGCPV